MFRWLPVLVVLLCLGCSTTVGWKPVCRHKALYAASVVGESHEVRIAWGPGHVEAQALVEGEWRPLALDGGWIIVKNRGFKPTWYESFGDYTKHFERWFKEGK